MVMFSVLTNIVCAHCSVVDAYSPPMTLNPNCITGLYQNAEAFSFRIGLSETVQCNLSAKWRSREQHRTVCIDFKCARATCTKSRSIIVVVFNNSFLPLTTRRMEKTIAATRK